MKKISLHTFKHTLRDIHTNTENRRFCFVIGAGASYKSGIPTGGQLAKKWFTEIKERYNNEEFKEWINIEKINKKDLASHYGTIYRKRFENDKTSGYEFLVQAMRSAKPTFGHIVLAQILTRAPGNCILTTNFDSLVESSIYQYTDKTPLVCGHESLSGYARPSEIHPLIIKIHRDLLLSPKSDPDEINSLDERWKEPLDNIFSSHIPIIVGYGGNDGSLMAYFEKMNKPSNFFWCGHKGTPASNRVLKLVEQMDGSYIDIDGFDEMMQELLWVFDEIKPIKEELDSITKSRIEAMNKQLQDMNIMAASFGFNKASQKKELSAFEYSNLADNEPNLDKRKAIYQEALKSFPETAWLWGDYAFFLHFEKKDFTNLDAYYKKALALEPDNSIFNGNYAIYLDEIKDDYKNAEKHYLTALSIDPNNSNNNGNYALFLEKRKKDYESAEKYYIKALSIEPDNTHNNENYALFLAEIKNDSERAEKHFIKALSVNPENAQINGNFAIFLYENQKDYTKAEQHFVKALSLEPNHGVINENYALYLTEIKKDFKSAEMHFLKALSINPEDSDLIGNYARFLYEIKKDHENAEANFILALTISPNNASLNGNYAIFLNEIKKNPTTAEKYYLKALSIEPENADLNGNYAQILLITNRLKDATKYLEKAFITINNEIDGLLIELWFYKYAHYLESLDESEKTIEKLLKEGVRSVGWNLEDNIEVAIKNGHPNPNRLKEFAERITKDVD